MDILKERDRWPVQILLDVLQKLIEETPRDILARYVQIVMFKVIMIKGNITMFR